MNTEEMLAALKDSKRVVELKYQNILVEKGNFESKLLCLNQSNELMQVNQSFTKLTNLSNSTAKPNQFGTMNPFHSTGEESEPRGEGEDS